MSSGEPSAGHEEEREIAWLAMPEKAPVVGRDGEEIGRAAGLLGDEGDDIFHGIVVKLTRGRKVEVAADRIPKITTRRVYTDLGVDELEQMPEFKG
ncbi:MAG TPA: hypothetical protein VGD57_02575 [Candidatus Dormibacteraeota bacterium]